MSKKAYIFSQLFRDVRMNSGLSQWIVSVKAGTHLSNVNQIEAGHQEPRVHVAVRLDQKFHRYPKKNFRSS
mgnify:CR=1 FL=1